MTTDHFSIRFATASDIPLILEFIRELAEYEQELDHVVATEDLLREWLFEKKTAETLIGELEGEPVAFALFFHNFSTYLGRGGIYLEDLFVRPGVRGRGFGKRMFQELARIAVQRKCGRLEWSCLDWNTGSIAFYHSLGAEAQSDRTIYRLVGDTLTGLAGEE